MSNTFTKEEADAIVALPPLYTLPPIVLDKSKKIAGHPDIQFYCSKCEVDIPKEMVRAKITESYDVTEVFAYGICTPCRHVTNFRFRAQGNGTILIKLKDGWKLFEAQQRKLNLASLFWRKLAKFLMPFSK